MRRAALAFALVAATLPACSKPKTYTSTVEVVFVQRFGQEGKAGVMDLELRFDQCPGEAKRIVRADKTFAECIGAVKAGDKLPVSIVSEYNGERGNWRSDLTKIGACPIKVDPKEEANYEMVQVCTDLTATGATVGVQCDRTRPKALTDKCPWLKRN